MRLLVCSCSLGIIAKMGTRTIIVIVTKGIDSIFVELTIGVEDILLNLDVTNGAGGGSCAASRRN